MYGMGYTIEFRVMDSDGELGYDSYTYDTLEDAIEASKYSYAGHFFLQITGPHQTNLGG